MKKSPQPNRRSRSDWIRLLPFAFLWIATAAACLLAPSPAPGDSSGIVMSLPSSLGTFEGESAEPDEGELRLLPKDTEFAKALYYASEEKDPWSAAYCSIIRTGSDRRSIHRPEICMEGQGWTIQGSRIVSIPIENGKQLKVTVLSLGREESFQDGSDPVMLNGIYVYWFVGKDVSTPSNNERLLLTISDNLIRNINHRWAYTSVMAYATSSFDDGSRSIPETEEFVFEVIGKLSPIIQPNL